MPFNYLLTNLLVDVPEAVGAIFLDPEGEAVEWVTRHGDPYDLKVEGAYHSIFKRSVEAVAEATSGGVLRGYVLAGSELIALTQVLPGGYYVVLVVTTEGSTSRAWYHLGRTSKVLAREVE